MNTPDPDLQTIRSALDRLASRLVTPEDAAVLEAAEVYILRSHGESFWDLDSAVRERHGARCAPCHHSWHDVSSSLDSTRLLFCELCRETKRETKEPEPATPLDAEAIRQQARREALLDAAQFLDGQGCNHFVWDDYGNADIERTLQTMSRALRRMAGG